MYEKIQKFSNFICRMKLQSNMEILKMLNKEYLSQPGSKRNKTVGHSKQPGFEQQNVFVIKIRPQNKCVGHEAFVAFVPSPNISLAGN